MNQKGFVNVVIVIGVIIVAGIAGYFVLNQRSTTSSISTSTSSPRPIPNPQSINSTPAHLISPDQVVQMEALMKKNGKSLEGLQAYRFKNDEIGMTHIRFYVYVNGVRAYETIYHFKNGGTLSSITSDFDASVFSNISTVPKISESQAIAIASSKIRNLSLVATKEFWNKGTNNSEAKNIVLAWRVHPAGASSVFTIIDAQTGEIIYYDDGIRY